MNPDFEKIFTTYITLLHQQNFKESELDYAIFDRHLPLLQGLSSIGNSVVSVFDCFKKNHIFYSNNFGQFLGYTLDQITEGGEHFLDTKIHPEDYFQLLKNGVSILKLFYQFSTEEKLNYKLLNEYRILNASGNYIRVIEQHQILELDPLGNLWLSLSIKDISPNQDLTENIKSQLINFKTGQIIPFNLKEENVDIVLTPRETQILKLVKDGLLSKEISSELKISLHTVNTHRQRFLEKLGVNNSMEAVFFASKLGLI